MMTQEEVKHIALLARIGLSDEEVTKYGRPTVFAWFEQLVEADMSQVVLSDT
jgi:Asp-tRNA(Asn)/Glu-tRNA(Gln) amidotransferase C subunit